MIQVKRKIVIAVSALVIVFVVSGGYSNQFSILPGFEGLKAGADAFETDNGFVYTTSQSLPSAYVWGNKDPHQLDVAHPASSWGSNDMGNIRLRVSEPEKFSSGYEQPREITYWVQNGNEWIHVVGEVKVYRIYLSLKTLTDSDRYMWDSEKFWITLNSVTWNKASTDPFDSSKWGKTWEAPLAAYVVSSDIQSAGSPWTGFEPSKGGDPVTLYSTRSQSGLISDLGLVGGDINNTLSNIQSPDSRLTSTAYFALSLTQWGADIGLFGVTKNYPSANIEIKVYTLIIGKYVYTNPEMVDWEDDKGEAGGWGAGIAGFLSFLQSPFGLGMLGLVLIAVIMVGAVIVVAPIINKIV